MNTSISKSLTYPVHSYACLAVHSALEVGLLSANMSIGGAPAACCGGFNAANSRQMASVKIPAWALTPMSAVGFFAYEHAMAVLAKRHER